MATTQSEPSLVPELLVSDVSQSIEFWCGLCGFEIDYERPNERFAYITLESAHIMLEQQGIGRNWITAPMERPLGRGINLQITVPSIEPIEIALNRASYSLFMPPETKWYRIGDSEEAGVRQILVTDPDGYLVRFQESLGHRSTQSPRTIRFSPDWGRREPLWDSDAWDIAVKASDLPITSELREGLYNYMDFWKGHFDPFEDWDSDSTRNFHVEEGARLVRELAEQLQGYAEIVDIRHG